MIDTPTKFFDINALAEINFRILTYLKDFSGVDYEQIEYSAAG